MADTIKTIPTAYGGRRFRSRLEARWAVFFDAIEIAWVYEPEGFILTDGEPLGVSGYDSIEAYVSASVHSLKTRGVFPRRGDVWYLPDFYLPDLGCYIEIKPSDPTDTEIRKARLLAQQTGRRVFVFSGQPGHHLDGGYPSGQTPAEWSALVFEGDEFGSVDAYFAWCVCPTCDQFGIAREGRGELICLHLGWAGRPVYSFNDPRLIRAYNAANGARF